MHKISLNLVGVHFDGGQKFAHQLANANPHSQTALITTTYDATSHSFD